MQVVGYETGASGDDPPALLLSDGETIRPEAVAPSSELAYSLGERHCAGVFDGAEHRVCPRPDAPYCDAHSSTWVCARCTGTCLKDEMDCFEDHAIYLAAFAPATFKVGVTRAWRLDTRLREQGADRAAHLRTVEDGRVARRIEAELAKEFTDRVRVPQKMDGLHRAVNETEWEAALAEFDPVETFAFDYGFELDSRPVVETVATGTVLGTKGRVLVLERGGTNYAVDMRELVGYELREEKSERELQSSLGAF